MASNGFVWATVEALLSLVTEGPADGVDPATALLARLDALAAAMHQLEPGFDPADYLAAPAWSDDARRALVSERFGQLGLYATVSPQLEALEHGQIGVGDAVDDLADIIGDLQAALWRRAHTSEADATWHLAHSFAAHWGDHLRGLQGYLHASGVLATLAL